MFAPDNMQKINGPGGIQCPDLYARAKMLNNTGWLNKLPRGITPSDIDLVFENKGRTLLVELSPTIRDWKFVAAGQRGVYETQVLQQRGACASVIARHETEYDKYIDTLRDIKDWELMYWDSDRSAPAYRVYGPEDGTWEEFVLWWFYNGWFSENDGSPRRAYGR